MKDNVVDIDFDKAGSVKGLVDAFESTGFQASNLHGGARIAKDIFEDKDCTTFLAFTANLVASGLRGVIAETVKRGLVDAVITTGGAIDHDLIKSFDPYLMGSFDTDDVELHKKGVNRIGNIFVPNERYVMLEEKVQPVFKRVCEKKKVVTPSELTRELSTLVKDEHSFLYWCAKKKVPVFSPCFIDSALGLQLYYFHQDHRDFALDELGDLKELGTIVLSAKRTGAIVLGGGPSKHFTIASNIIRGGLDKAVYVTTAQEWDGSLSGAETKEAKSWGKIKENASHVTVHGDATILYPLMLKAALE